MFDLAPARSVRSVGEKSEDAMGALEEGFMGSVTHSRRVGLEFEGGAPQVVDKVAGVAGGVGEEDELACGVGHPRRGDHDGEQG